MKKHEVMKEKFYISQKKKDLIIDHLKAALEAQTKLTVDATANVASLEGNLLSLKNQGTSNDAMAASYKSMCAMLNGLVDEMEKTKSTIASRFPEVSASSQAAASWPETEVRIMSEAAGELSSLKDVIMKANADTGKQNLLAETQMNLIVQLQHSIENLQAKNTSLEDENKVNCEELNHLKEHNTVLNVIATAAREKASRDVMRNAMKNLEAFERHEKKRSRSTEKVTHARNTFATASHNQSAKRSKFSTASPSSTSGN